MVKTEVIKPPDALLLPCPRPETTRLDTNDDLIRFASEAVAKWEICAGQVDALRDFLSNSEKDSQNYEKDSQNYENQN